MLVVINIGDGCGCTTVVLSKRHGMCSYPWLYICGYLSPITDTADVVVVMVVWYFIIVTIVSSKTQHLAQLACFVRVVHFVRDPGSILDLTYLNDRALGVQPFQ